MSLAVAAVPAMQMRAFSSGAFDGFEGGVADGVDMGDALSGGRVAEVRDDEAHRFSVR